MRHSYFHIQKTGTQFSGYSKYAIFVVILITISCVRVPEVKKSARENKHNKHDINCKGCHSVSQEVTMDRCSRCHSDYKETTRELYPNPHVSHCGDISCLECHRNHGDSIDFCSQCHKFEFKVP